MPHHTKYTNHLFEHSQNRILATTFSSCQQLSFVSLVGQPLWLCFDPECRHCFMSRCMSRCTRHCMSCCARCCMSDCTSCSTSNCMIGCMSRCMHRCELLHELLRRTCVHTCVRCWMHRPALLCSLRDACLLAGIVFCCLDPRVLIRRSSVCTHCCSLSTCHEICSIADSESRDEWVDPFVTTYGPTCNRHPQSRVRLSSRQPHESPSHATSSSRQGRQLARFHRTCFMTHAILDMVSSRGRSLHAAMR